MKKQLFALSVLLLASCGKQDIIPSNKPYYCTGYSGNGWLIAFPNYLFSGKLVKSGANYYFVNTSVTKHGFHGNIENDTKFYGDNNKEIFYSELSSYIGKQVYAYFSPSKRSNLDDNTMKWIQVTSGRMPEKVSALYLISDYKTAEIPSFIDETDK